MLSLEYPVEHPSVSLASFPGDDYRDYRGIAGMWFEVNADRSLQDFQRWYSSAITKKPAAGVDARQK